MLNVRVALELLKSLRLERSHSILPSLPSENKKLAITLKIKQNQVSAKVLLYFALLYLVSKYSEEI